jgi:hypothetical protein
LLAGIDPRDQVDLAPDEDLFGPIFHDAPPDPMDLIRSSNHVSDTRNLKTGERQSCEQLIDVDEPHAKQMNPTSNSMMNSEPHAEA